MKKKSIFKKKNLTFAAILLVTSVTTTAGCASSNELQTHKSETKESSAYTEADKVENEKLKIVTTVFPEYDWVNEISKNINEQIDIELLGGGVDLHSYQPTLDDIIKISDCDLFIYVGGESDDWVRDALYEIPKDNTNAISLIDVLGDKAKLEESIEGMQEEPGEKDNEESNYDEHVWLSLSNAKTFCEVIAKELAGLDAENEAQYKNNLDNYIQELNELDEKYKQVSENATNNTLIFGDRFPFRYLLDDYGLRYFAAFPGCAAESEASFETIAFLSEKVDETGAKSVIKIEGGDSKIAETIAKNAKSDDIKILTLDSMQSISNEDIESGKTYISVMEDNLEVLKEALR